MSKLHKFLLSIGTAWLVLVSASTAAQVISGDFLYTYSVNTGRGLYKATYSYDPVAGTFTVGGHASVAQPVADLSFHGHIAINPQNPDLVIAVGNPTFANIGAVVNVDKNTGAASSLATAAEVLELHTLDIPNSTTVLGATMYEHLGAKLIRFRIGAGGVLHSPAEITINGDFTMITDVITTPAGTFSLQPAGNYCGGMSTKISLGTLTYDTGDVTTATAATIRHLVCLTYTDTGEYDAFSNSLIFAGDRSHIMQVALDGTILSDFNYISPTLGVGTHYQGIAVDGRGHAFITGETGSVLLYFDFSGTGILDDPGTFIGDIVMPRINSTGNFLFGVAFATFPDTDGDGIPDNEDPCPLDPENDADGDGYCGDVDICPLGDDGLNTDGDSLPDACDVCPLDAQNDADGDGVCESDDNCPLDANPGQGDNDADGQGDVCDPDDDNDTFPDETDNCPLQANDQSDWDGDGAGDECDTDADGDGVQDLTDACPYTPIGEVVNAAGCSIAGLCPCEHPTGGDKWKNHGAYVSCVAHLAKVFREAGLISVPDEDNIVAIAGMSSCGQKIK